MLTEIFDEGAGISQDLSSYSVQKFQRTSAKPTGTIGWIIVIFFWSFIFVFTFYIIKRIKIDEKG